MEIQGNPIGPRVTQDSGVTPAATNRGDAGKADSAGTNASGGSRVALSEQARSMMALRSEVDSAPDVRQGLVDEISQRIASGTYNVRGQLVAEAMVNHAAFEAVA